MGKCSIFIQYIKNVGNGSKIGVHTSNCCLKKWAEEYLDEKIGPCELTLKEITRVSSFGVEGWREGKLRLREASNSQPLS